MDLLPSVCAMASDVSKSAALKQSWRASAFASLQEFLAKFAPEIVQLQKKEFKECCEQLSIQKACRVEASSELFCSSLWKDLLQDWELVLCDVSSLESVALLSGLQRCFERVDAFLKEHAEPLKKIAAKNLDTALRSRYMAQFPMATFARVFLERYEEQLETKQLESLSSWKENLCKQRASDQEAKIAKRRKAVLDLQEFFAKFAPEIVQLQKKDLRSVANSFQAKKHAEWMQAKIFFIRHFDFLAKFAPEIVQLQKKDLRSVANSSQSKKHAEWRQAQNFFVRHFDFLALEEKDLLQDWELVLCDVSSLESVALLSAAKQFVMFVMLVICSCKVNPCTIHASLALVVVNALVQPG